MPAFHFARHPLALALTAAFALTACGGGGDSPAAPAAPGGLGTVDTAPLPSATAFVDTYQTNVAANTTVATNASLRLLSDFSTLWTPGSSFNNGTATAVGAPILAANIQQNRTIAASRTQAEQDAAYLDDRRSQNFSVLSGLGPLQQAFVAGSGATTTIAGVATDATTVKYDDAGNGAGTATSQLGSVVALIATLRGNFSSTNPAKGFYQYQRPFRWLNDTGIVIPALRPAISTMPATDGGFPSGHTNAAYLASYALAYAVPQRYQELLTRASQLGQNRVVAGMHSPTDVIGGRIMGTALAAAILNDSANAAIKNAAYAQAQSYLQARTGTDANSLDAFAHGATNATDPQAGAAANRAAFLQRMTYGFPPIAAPTATATVPKGAEVLLETRLPYLDAAQRRIVLKTTAVASGHPLLGDAEGWGRLNLAAAADGYGAFNGDATVSMDASKGGFHAADTWRNDIAGAGKLTKQGSGTLTLAGTNSYTGGTELQGGTLVAGSASALGKGDVYLSGGSLQTSPNAVLTLGGQFTQRAGGTLNLVLGSAGGGTISGTGTATLDGTLRISFAAGFQPTAGQSITVLGTGLRSGTFSAVQVGGTVPASVAYTDNGVLLSFGS
ncbi:acid phosphatase [Xylophilus ampelinus]|uniref:Autotransporter-associated beta strand protein n=1 Tax=Xylophilus ampelinus TaxID=54067 RepID=A0A318SK45_9BURK|nr:phosphatase PAP2 family protein [Xylophilus ampelinus]MCS4509664.1 phosphatase PAP2 family protein [Xylophilus ampelinus]PYE78851.1 autotransporter-associated beta strand protein [Xylophilus ampelinus]